MAAADFIILRIHPGHPKVLRLAELTGEDPFTACGRTVAWFRHVDEHCASRNTGLGRDAVNKIMGVSIPNKRHDPAYVNDLAKQSGTPRNRNRETKHGNEPRASRKPHLGRAKANKVMGVSIPNKSRCAVDVNYFTAMQDPSVNWIRGTNDGTAVIVEFDKNFGNSSKRRYLEAKRKAEYRLKKEAQSKRSGSADVAQNRRKRAPVLRPNSESESEIREEKNSSSRADGKVPPDASRSLSPPSSPPARNIANVRYQAAIGPLLGRAGNARHPRESPQWQADYTVARQWWDEVVWPEESPTEQGEQQLAEFLALIDKAARKDRPMAWLTDKLKRLEVPQ